MGNFHTSFTLIFSTLTLFSSTVTASQDSVGDTLNNEDVVEAYDDDSLDVIVVTGTKSKRKLLDVPVRTEVVSEKEIKTRHDRDLSETMKYVSSVQLTDIHGKDGKNIIMQGLNADQTLVLLDGLPTNLSANEATDITKLSLAGIKQIEIVKGAVSSLYGSNAMAGVVNIITKRPFDSGNGYELTFDAGSYGDANVRDGIVNDGAAKLYAYASDEDWYLKFVGDVRSQGGVDLDKTTYSINEYEGTKYNLSLAGGYRFSNGTVLEIKPSWYMDDIHAPYLGQLKPPHGRQKKDKIEKNERTGINVSVEKQLTDIIFASGYYIYSEQKQTSHQDFISTPKIDQTRTASSDAQKAELKFSIDITDVQLLTLGVVAESDSVEQTNDGLAELKDAKNEKVEFYAQDEIFITDELEVVPGFRYQDDKDFGSKLTPSLNARYSPAKLSDYQVTLRAGIGSGYKTPNLKERFYIFDHSALGYMVLGNRDLKPESSTSYQLGVDFRVNEKTSLALNTFSNKLENLIDTGLDKDKSTNELAIYSYLNVSKAKTEGFEGTLTAKITDNLKAEVSYNHLVATNLDNNPELNGKTLPERAKHTYLLTTSYSVPSLKTEFSVAGKYKSKVFVDERNNIESPGYSTIDFKANTKISDNLKVFIGINNATNVVQDASNNNDLRPSKGRYIYAGFEYKG
ncbi:TonB-dependent receptor plug domain-containing protein [Veronia pacifica]|uniref:TonB-dependent receptor n=1 Tax=Veronia pacifica TaxID=1080227 RepID=A0A1C3EMQ2_9GAMM|nr:hypothetical protein A8L45_05970 [Veronia pacifica]